MRDTQDEQGRDDQQTYGRAEVEAYLAASWTSYGSRAQLPGRAPAETRKLKGTSDPRRLSDELARRADLQRAWLLAPLTHRQRQALVLRYGLDLTLKEAGETLGVTGSSVSARIERGLEHLTVMLNGPAAA